MRLGLKLSLATNRPQGSSFSSETNAVLSYATSQGYTLPSDSTITELDTLIISLKDNGIWNKLDVLYILATDGDSDFAKINIKNPGSYSCIDINTPGFISLQGVQGSAVTSSALDTTFAPGSHGVNWDAASKSASFGCYLYASPSLGNGLIGSSSINTKRTGARTYINGNSVGSTSSGIGTNHLNFSSIEKAYYKNGSLIATGVNTSNVEDTTTFKICAETSSTEFSDAIISIAFVGADLSNEAAALHSIFNTYVSSL